MRTKIRIEARPVTTLRNVYSASSSQATVEACSGNRGKSESIIGCDPWSGAGSQWPHAAGSAVRHRAPEPSRCSILSFEFVLLVRRTPFAAEHDEDEAAESENRGDAAGADEIHRAPAVLSRRRVVVI